MGNCDNCGKKFGWMQHRVDIYDLTLLVVHHNQWSDYEKIRLTKFDNVGVEPLRKKAERMAYRNSKFCDKCTNEFFLPYAREFSFVQDKILNKYNFAYWVQKGGADILEQADIIQNKINEAVEELKGRRLETCYVTGNNALYPYENELLKWEHLEMGWDARHTELTRALEHWDMLTGNATVGYEKLMDKYHDSYKKERLAANRLEWIKAQEKEDDDSDKSHGWKSGTTKANRIKNIQDADSKWEGRSPI